MDGLRRCNVYKSEYCYEEKKSIKVFLHTGLFHAWGVSFMEMDQGPGNFTVAIVELETGEIITPEASLIAFQEPL